MHFVISFICLLNALTLSFQAQSITIETLYETAVIDEPVVCDLLESRVMQRLQEIDQSGICHYTGRIGPYSRYIHSVGVYLLLKRFQAPLEEQVAGLLHDASHTVFSHTGDWIFLEGSHDRDSYQDDIHAWYLEKQGVTPILEKHGINLKESLAKGNGYVGLDQDLPDICADRLEYNLFTGHLEGFFTVEDVRKIVDDVHFEKGRWYFEDPVLAAKFAYVSVYFTENVWAAPWNIVSNELCARALKRAFKLNLVSLDEIHFSTDDVVLGKLNTAEDEEIRALMHQCQHVDNYFVECAPAEENYSCKCKFRGIDPWVKVNGEFVRLTSIDDSFAHYYHAVKKKVGLGVHVRILGSQ